MQLAPAFLPPGSTSCSSSSSRVISGQRDERSTAPNLLLHQAPSGRLCAPHRLGGGEERGGRQKLPEVLLGLGANGPASPPRTRLEKRFLLTNGKSLQQGGPCCHSRCSTQRLTCWGGQGRVRAAECSTHHSPGEIAATRKKQAAKEQGAGGSRHSTRWPRRWDAQRDSSAPTSVLGGHSSSPGVTSGALGSFLEPSASEGIKPWAWGPLR